MTNLILTKVSTIAIIPCQTSEDINRVAVHNTVSSLVHNDRLNYITAANIETNSKLVRVNKIQLF